MQPSPDHEAAIEAIASTARAARKPTPRWLWIVAGIIGLGCAIAFVAVLVRDGDPGGVELPAASSGRGGLGFAAGIGVGLIAGISIGLAVARQLGARDHSSRNKP